MLKGKTEREKVSVIAAADKAGMCVFYSVTVTLGNLG